jgi:pseudaminic acid synthase
MKKEILLQGRQIGHRHPPFIIAEMSGNHNQSLDRAIQIVDAAAASGVHALKLQTYTADTMTIDMKEGDFFIDDPKSLWNGLSLYELYQKAFTPWEWHKPIMDRCRQHGLLCFSTPFDESAVVFLESLDVPCYKIASFENGDIPLIRRVAATGKPLMISTGMASLADLDEAVRTARESGCKDLILLKCTSSYPSSPEHSNIVTIPHLRELFDCEVGLSDHTLGLGAAIASIAVGARVIEKHFTLSRAQGGVDAAFSLEPDEMKALVAESERAWMSLGKVSYRVTDKERTSLRFRRSLYVVKDLKAGDILNKDNLRSIRPGFGLPPRFYDVLLGKRVSRNVKRGTAVSWDLVE